MAITKLKPAETAGYAPPERGHNRPPLEALIPLEFREELLRLNADAFNLMDDYLGTGDPNAEDFKPGAVDRAACADEESLGRCGRTINALRALEKIVSDAHATVKAPYLQGGRLVDAEKNALFGRIQIGRQKVQGLMDDYAAEQLRQRRKEEARLQAIRDAEIAEERRRAAEAREAGVKHVPVAPSPPPELFVRSEPLRTDGATVSMGTEWDAVVEDYAKAFRRVKDDAKVREAIEAAIKKIVKATKGQVAIPGVRAFERAKASAR